MTNILSTTKPKLGFVGVGWIGLNRLKAIKETGVGEVRAAVDPNPDVVKQMQKEIGDIKHFETYEEMLDSDIEGVVIATPSAMHAEQSIAALEKGKAVFCQKPLGRNAEETIRVVETAKKRNSLLGVDFSYRYMEAVKRVKEVIQSGEIGKVYGINLVFHNAWGPDKPWYYDVRQSGGGCVMDLGVHLVDLLFWILGESEIQNMHSRIFRKGKHLKWHDKEAEDYAAAQFTVNNHSVVQLVCSWDLPAGQNAVIQAFFYGEEGGAAVHNLDGSFYHFTAKKFVGTSTEVLTTPSDLWEGRAAVQWCEKLSKSNSFDPGAQVYTKVAGVLDMIYQNAT